MHGTIWAEQTDQRPLLTKVNIMPEDLGVSSHMLLFDIVS